jgi:hypothetical protein
MTHSSLNNHQSEKRQLQSEHKNFPNDFTILLNPKKKTSKI